VDEFVSAKIVLAFVMKSLAMHKSARYRFTTYAARVLTVADKRQRGETSPVSAEEISIERLERGLIYAAKMVEIHGNKALPIFERLERELVALQEQQGAKARAKRLLENFMRTARQAGHQIEAGAIAALPEPTES
jgi:hypothetical protein